ncbi:MAG TPA: hypothetical protein VFU21_32210 [Kofleriaceae bacterium]|nr:hypothetical protein [Kofleriaceae bacterium]
MRILGTSAALAAALAVACGGDDAGGGDGGPGDGGGEMVDIAIAQLRQLDVLFVIDDSGTMVQEQQALASGFPAFVDALAGGDGETDLHIGFVSSNLGTAPAGTGGEGCAGEGDEGHLLVRSACPALTGDELFVAHRIAAGGEAETNYTGELADQLQCMAQLGTGGCGFEQHLESMKRALENDAENAGFLRPEANLAVIVVADEDDCSASDRALFIAQGSGDTRDSLLGELTSYRCFEFGVACAEDAEGERAIGPRTDCVPDDESTYIEPVGTYAQFLTELKGGRHRVAVASIVGDVEPVAVDLEPGLDRLWVVPECMVCPGGGSECTTLEALVAAAPAIRLHALADRFSGRSQVEDICAYDDQAGALDYTAALARIGSRLRIDAGTRCLETAPADRDPDAAGLQPLCEVVEGEQAIPSCSELSAPCWSLAHAPECEGSETALVIDRGDTEPAGGALTVRCAP